jgi:hypothetical protein
MKGLIKFFILLIVIVFVSALFKGGDYIRSFSDMTGINLYSLANTADDLRIERFMSEKQRDQAEMDKARQRY